MAPLTVADQIYNDVFPEKPLVVYGQPSGSKNFLCMVSIDVDHSAVHHLTCGANMYVNTRDRVTNSHLKDSLTDITAVQ